MALIDISSSNPQPTTLSLSDYQQGISAIVLKASTAVACGPAGFAVLNVGPNLLTLASFAAAPVSVSSTGNTFVPGTCDFDGSTAVFADSSSNSDNIYWYSISGGNATYHSASNTGLYPPVSIAVLGSQTAVGSQSSGDVWLGVSTTGAPVSATTVPGAAGIDALKFLAGQPVLAVGTNNGSKGSGVSLYSTTGWPAIAGNPMGVVANGKVTTLGFTYITIPQGCITALLKFLSNPFGG
jgi:hypothetical protein